MAVAALPCCLQHARVGHIIAGLLILRHCLPACVPPRWIGRHTGAVRKLLGGSESSPAIDTLQTLEEDTELSQEEFKKLLETIDSGLRALPATAQVRAPGCC